MQPDTFRFLEIKEVSEDGSFEGIASVYGVEDLGGDVIDKGAFKKTVSENPTVKILWQHDPSEVIGAGEVKEWQGKLLLRGKLDLEDPVGLKAYRKLKAKLLDGLSIGFQTIKSTWEEIEHEGARKYIRHIQELKLWEVSVVTFPMLPSATVTRVKSADADEIKSLKEQVQALTAEVATLKGAGVAGSGAAAPNPEPAADHSEVASALDAISALIPR